MSTAPRAARQAQAEAIGSAGPALNALERSLASLAEDIPCHYSKRVVIFRYDKIGDLIIISSLFRAIKENSPAAHVTLVCSAYNKDVLRHSPYIDRFVVYDPGASLWNKGRFALALRRVRPDASLVMSPNKDGYILGFLSGAARRAGMILSYRRFTRLLAPILLTDVEVIRRDTLNKAVDPHYHQSRVALRLAARLGLGEARARSLEIGLDPAAVAWAAARTPSRTDIPSRPILLLHLGGSWKSCGLDEPEVVRLAAQLCVRFPEATLLMTAGPADVTYYEAMAAEFREIQVSNPLELASPERYPNSVLFSGLGFEQWSALIGAATVIITPDTGAVHLASAHGVPIAVVYPSDRFNRLVSMFGPSEVPFRALSKARNPDLGSAILTSVAELLAEGPRPRPEAID